MTTLCTSAALATILFATLSVADSSPVRQTNRTAPTSLFAARLEVDYRGTGNATVAAVSRDMRLIVIYMTDNRMGGFAAVWNTEVGKEIVRIPAPPSSGWIAISPDATTLAVASKREHRYTYQATDNPKVFTTRDHGVLHEGLQLFDLSSGALVREIDVGEQVLATVAFSPDGRSIATGSTSGEVATWDVMSASNIHVLHRDGQDSASVYGVTFSPDGRQLLTTHDNEFRLLDAESGNEIRRFTERMGTVWSAEFSPDGRFALTASSDGTARLWDLARGAVVQTYRLKGATPGRFDLVAATLSPDGKCVVTAGGSTESNFAVVWDRTSGRQIQELAGHPTSTNSVVYARSGRYIVTTGYDGTARVWDSQTGRQLVQMVSFGDGSWAAVDPQGRYDASHGGDVRWLYWIVGDERIELSQLKDRYYEPGLIAKILSNAPLRNVDTFREVALFPEVSCVAPTKDSTKLAVALKNRGGGIGRVRVLVNGKEIAADARGLKPEPDAPAAAMTVDLGDAPVIAGKPNTIEVIAWNADGTLSSRGVKVLWTPEGTAREVKPELYAVVVGVSDYEGEALDLRFAAKDAADFATALDAGAKTLFGADRVHISLLTTAPGAVAPTKENIAKAFDAARAARPEDIFVVYLAGHGTAIAGSDTYCYLTKDSRGFSELADPAIRSLTAVTDSELVEWIKKVPALKQVMVLDTCAAGAASAKLTEQRDVTGDQVRAIDRLKDRTGFFVLMGSAADAVSYEATQFGQGLLTYSLLKAMKGASLRDGTFADVMTLFGYAADEVPELARNVGGIQRPLVASPRGSSFDIGQFGEAEKRRVPLASPRPMVLRPSFLNARGRDVLELSTAVRRELAEQTRALVRGAEGAAVVYVDGEELPGAVVPSGIYTVDGETVRVTLVLSKDGKEVEIDVIGTKADIAAKVVAAINALVARLG
jgi:WD40 repeat protein